MRDMQGTQRSHCRHLLLGTSDGSALISECPSKRFLGYAYRCKFVFVFGVFVICLPPSVSWCMPECLQLYCQCVYVMFFSGIRKDHLHIVVWHRGFYIVWIGLTVNFVEIFPKKIKYGTVQICAHGTQSLRKSVTVNFLWLINDDYSSCSVYKCAPASHTPVVVQYS